MSVPSPRYSWPSLLTRGRAQGHRSSPPPLSPRRGSSPVAPVPLRVDVLRHSTPVVGVDDIFGPTESGTRPSTPAEDAGVSDASGVSATSARSLLEKNNGPGIDDNATNVCLVAVQRRYLTENPFATEATRGVWCNQALHQFNNQPGVSGSATLSDSQKRSVTGLTTKFPFETRS